jgi:hypothetical protein
MCDLENIEMVLISPADPVAAGQISTAKDINLCTEHSPYFPAVGAAGCRAYVSWGKTRTWDADGHVDREEEVESREQEVDV